MKNLGKLIYKENIKQNYGLKRDILSNAVALLSAVFILFVALLCYVYISTVWKDLCVVFVGTSATAMLLIFAYRLSRIKPLEVYEYGFLYPYYNGPRDRKIFWQDIYLVVCNIRETPNSIIIILSNGRFLHLKKYAVSDIGKFISILEEKGVKVEKREMNLKEVVREAQKRVIPG